MELPIGSFNYTTVPHEKGAYSIILNSSVHGPLTFTSLIAQPKPAEHFGAALAQYVGSNMRATHPPQETFAPVETWPVG